VSAYSNMARLVIGDIKRPCIVYLSINRCRETVDIVSAQDRESSKSSYPEAVVLVKSAVVVTSAPMSAISGISNLAETWTDTPMLEDAVEK